MTSCMFKRENSVWRCLKSLWQIFCQELVSEVAAPCSNPGFNPIGAGDTMAGVLMASLCSDIAKDVEERCLQQYVEQRLGCSVETSRKFFRWGSFGSGSFWNLWLAKQRNKQRRKKETRRTYGWLSLAHSRRLCILGLLQLRQRQGSPLHILTCYGQRMDAGSVILSSILPCAEVKCEGEGGKFETVPCLGCATVKSITDDKGNLQLRPLWSASRTPSRLPCCRSTLATAQRCCCYAADPQCWTVRPLTCVPSRPDRSEFTPKIWQNWTQCEPANVAMWTWQSEPGNETVRDPLEAASGRERKERLGILQLSSNILLYTFASSGLLAQKALLQDLSM